MFDTAPDLHPSSTRPVIAVVDHTPRGTASAHLASHLAEAFERPLLVTTVVPSRSSATSSFGRLRDERVRRAKTLLQRTASELDRPARTTLTAGEPADGLATLAHEHEASMIVLSRPAEVDGHSSGHAYLAIARTVACPVVVVPPDAGSLAWSDGPVVWAAQGTAASLGAADVASELADRLTAPLSHVRVAHDRGHAGPAALRRAIDRDRAQLVVIESTSASGGLDPVAARLARASAVPVVLVPAHAVAPHAVAA